MLFTVLSHVTLECSLLVVLTRAYACHSHSMLLLEAALQWQDRQKVSAFGYISLLLLLLLCAEQLPTWMRQVLQIFLHLCKSPTDAKNNSSVIACRRAAFSPCRLAPCVLLSSSTGGLDFLSAASTAATKVGFWSTGASIVFPCLARDHSRCP